MVGGHHGECGARAYNGGLGAESPAGSRGRARGQGVSSAPPEAESILVIGCPTDPANLAPVRENSMFCYGPLVSELGGQSAGAPPPGSAAYGYRPRLIVVVNVVRCVCVRVQNCLSRWRWRSCVSRCDVDSTRCSSRPSGTASDSRNSRKTRKSRTPTGHWP